MIGRVAIALALVASAAHADPKLKPEAKQILDAGLAAFDAKDYATASKHFEAAFVIDPQPFLVFSWAQSERLGGRCAKARELYERYLKFVLTNEQIRAAHDGLDACGPTRPKVALPPPPPPPPPPPVHVGRDGLDFAALGLAGAGAASLGLGIAFVVLAGESLDAAHAATFLDDHQRFLDEATSRRRIGWTATAIGAAALAGGLTLFAIHRHEVAIATDGHVLTASARW